MFSWFKTRDYVGDRVRPNSHHVFGLCWWNQSGYLEKKKKVIPTYTAAELRGH